MLLVFISPRRDNVHVAFNATYDPTKKEIIPDTPCFRYYKLTSNYVVISQAYSYQKSVLPVKPVEI